MLEMLTMHANHFTFTEGNQIHQTHQENMTVLLRHCLTKNGERCDMVLSQGEPGTCCHGEPREEAAGSEGETYVTSLRHHHLPLDEERTTDSTFHTCYQGLSTITRP